MREISEAGSFGLSEGEGKSPKTFDSPVWTAARSELLVNEKRACVICPAYSQNAMVVLPRAWNPVGLSSQEGAAARLGRLKSCGIGMSGVWGAMTASCWHVSGVNSGRPAVSHKVER